MNKIIVNPSPKTRLMASKPLLEAHRNLMQMPDLRTSFDFALLEYQGQLCSRANDGNTAAASLFKIQGALEFINVLLKLGEVPEVREIARPGEINHNA